MYYGAAAPIDPDFEIEGVEQPLERGEPRWDETSFPGEVTVVYVGDVNDRSVSSTPMDRSVGSKA